MKTTLKRKVLSLILTAVMLLGLLPLTVQAAEDICQIGTTNYTALGDALAAVTTGQTIKLLQNINYNSGISISDKRITFDLNGFTLNVNNSAGSGLIVSNGSVSLMGQGSFNVTGYDYGVYANSGVATVTSAGGTGQRGVGVYAVGFNSHITVSGDVTGIENGVYAENGGVIVTGGNATATANGSYVYAVNCRTGIITVGGDARAVNGNGVIAINGGRVTVNGSVQGKNSGVKAVEGGIVKIGGNVTATGGNGVYASYTGNITVQGNINAHATDKNFTYYGACSSVNSCVTVDGNITATGAAGVTVVGAGCSDARSNGKMIVDGTITAPIYIMVESDRKTAAQGVVTGDYYKYTDYWNRSSVMVKIPPDISGLTAGTFELPSEGGPTVITVTGAYLPSGLTVTAFDGNTPTAVTGFTAGSKTEQTVTLTFPANTSIEEHKGYTIKVSADGGTSWSDKTAAVTVTRQTGPDISGHFTDGNFKQAVWEWLGNEIGSTPGEFSQINLQERMADQGYILNIERKDIKSLTGLENIQGTGLKELFCADNKLTSLPVLPDSLIRIDLSRNYINVFSGPEKDKLATLAALPDEDRIFSPQYGYPALAGPVQIYVTDTYTPDIHELYEMSTIDGINWTGSQFLRDRSEFTFSSSDSNIAAVNAEGAITAKGVGTCEISALYGGVDAEYTKSVFQVTAEVTTYPVTYEGNGGTGTSPVESGKIAGAAFEAASAGILTAPVGKQFKEWNTRADGTGTGYPEGASVTMPAESLTLYAVWKDIPPLPPSGGGSDDGSGGGQSPSGNHTNITAEQLTEHLNANEPINVNLPQLNININPSALPSSGNSIQVEAEMVTDPNSLNTFFLAYPDQRGIMKGYNITFTQENNGETQNITQLNGEITLTFQLTSEELEGIDPSTLVVYKQGDDGGVTTLNGNFDWANNTISVSTSHLCKFYLMGKEGISTQRLFGENRYATAAAISAEGWETSDTVIVASGENFPDALAGAALAGDKMAPVLLTMKNRLPSETLSEIKRLKTKTIYILGGEDTISKTVEEQLSDTYTVVRMAGSDRYQTAVNIGQRIISDRVKNGENTKDSDTIILSTGLDFPDALAAAPFAGQNGLPVLFTEKEALNTHTRQALLDWEIKKVIITGGTNVISEQIENVLRNELAITVLRLSGEDRHLTSLAIAKHFEEYPEGRSGIGYKNAALVTGEDFPDALAGAALAAKSKYPILLTSKDKVNPEVSDYLREMNLEKLYIYGGKGVITDKVKDEISL